MSKGSTRRPVVSIAIFGGPGAGAMAAQSIARMAASGEPVRAAGFLNDALTVGTLVSDQAVVGTFADWPKLPEDTMFLAPLHKAKAMPERAARIAGLAIADERWARVIDPAACVADDAAVDDGSYVGAFAVVDPGAALGRHAAVFPGGQVGPDAIVGDYVFVGRGAIVSGRCRVRDGAHIGPGAVIGGECTIGRFAVIGAGAVVLGDVPDHAIVPADPARLAGRPDASANGG
ncbi:MAG: hypothetical protein JNL66_06020 [Alphaproteobacteria bacterium]|nr:hypothetical protein [Alphaproteobacteria bacterium]